MIADSLRREPQTEAEWLGPLPVRDWFAHPERRLEIDLGSGKGRFLLARAAKCPETNFLGIDRMLRRIRKVDNRARRLDLDNVRLMRVDGSRIVCVAPSDAEDEDEGEALPDEANPGAGDAVSDERSGEAPETNGEPDSLDRLVDDLEANPEPPAGDDDI